MYTYTNIQVHTRAKCPSDCPSQRVLQHGQLLKKLVIAHVPIEEIHQENLYNLHFENQAWGTQKQNSINRALNQRLSLDTKKLQSFCVEGTYSSLDTDKSQVFSTIRAFFRKNPRNCVFVSKTDTRRTGKIKQAPFQVQKIKPYVIKLNHSVIFNLCCKLHCFLVINTQSIFTQTQYVGDLSIGNQLFQDVFDTSSYDLVAPSESCVSSDCRKLHLRPLTIKADVSVCFLTTDTLNPFWDDSWTVILSYHAVALCALQHTQPSISSSRGLN